MKILIVGGGGRESAIAYRLGETDTVYPVLSHKNPSLLEVAQQSGGKPLFASPTDAAAIAEFAVRHGIDLAFVSADAPLEAGVVDQLRKAGIVAVGPTREAARIEWDKLYATRLMQRLFPSLTPRSWEIEDAGELELAFRQVHQLGLDIVVKPQGLTAGKGVKVMGPHLASLEEAKAYTERLLKDRPREAVLWVEKLSGPEFTIMGLTDGESVVLAPATYDHPYRFDGDSGPGTGGMGAFSDENGALPFLSAEDLAQCKAVMTAVLRELQAQGQSFSGVLNGGFFKTPSGLKFMEFNARFGDPEAINVLSAMKTPLAEVLTVIASKRLVDSPPVFAGCATVNKYLVSPEYALRTGPAHIFHMDVPAIRRAGVQVLFASAEATADPDTYITVGQSRCVALAATGPSVPVASTRIEQAIAAHVRGPLQWRRDLGQASYFALRA